MVVAWGIEINKPVDEVWYAVKALFIDDMLGGLYHILDWSVPRVGVDIVECFEMEDANQTFGYVPFLRWKAKADKPTLFKEVKDAWDRMWEEIIQVESGVS